MIMRKLSLLALGFLLVSCGPSVYTMTMEMRYPSASGIDLAGKNIGVFYAGGGSDSLANRKLAGDFAVELEKDYFNGRQAIEIYSLDGNAKKWEEPDSLRSLVMQTGEDVVFLLNPQFTTLHLYDSMNEKDAVYVQYGVTDAKTAAVNYLSSWKEETFQLMYYEDGTWLGALFAVYEYHWKTAMDMWISLLDTENYDKRSCAEYNIAVACYVLGDYELALKWLDRSDKDSAIIIYSKSLRAKINAKLGRP